MPSIFFIPAWAILALAVLATLTIAIWAWRRAQRKAREARQWNLVRNMFGLK